MSTNSPSGRQFPADFLWGSATASYQIEGAVAEGGRGPSIWDTFCTIPGAVLNGDTGEIADDHYHRMPEDVATMAELGLDAYRFSVSWSRVQPDGSGQWNEEGLAFYSELVDRLLAAGIRPVITLYHWDLPQALEDAGGWTVRETAYRFADYARTMAQTLGDRVEVWTTLNEPWCAAYLGYASGVHAPGRQDQAAALAAVHHLNLAHGLAATAIREVVGAEAHISITLNLHVTRADSAAPDDQAARRQIDLIGNEVFLQPLLEGRYPPEAIAQTSHVSDWAFVHDGDLEVIRQPLTMLGVNYYSTGRVRRLHGEPAVGDGSPGVDGHKSSAVSPWVGADDVEWLPQPGPHTAMDWNIDPQGLVDLLVSLSERYPNLPLAVTENGAAFPDVVDPDGRVRDVARINYLHDHIDAVGEAITRGADVRGYFLWSLMDNFEWAYGYDRRFGIIRVADGTLDRVWKDSAYWYQNLIRSRTLAPVTPVTDLP